MEADIAFRLLYAEGAKQEMCFSRETTGTAFDLKYSLILVSSPSPVCPAENMD